MLLKLFIYSLRYAANIELMPVRVTQKRKIRALILSPPDAMQTIYEILLDGTLGKKSFEEMLSRHFCEYTRPI